MSQKNYIPEDLANLYEILDFKHAAAILAKEFPQEFSDNCSALIQFRFSRQDLLKAGGNESHTPKMFLEILRPKDQ